MAVFPDYLRIKESQESLLVFIRQQTANAGACPACGSLFLLHICHADPRKGDPAPKAKPKMKGLRADLVVLDEITDWDEMSLGERRIKES